eukprot:762678-Prorocentrum_minimum.AAC.1
MTGPQTGPLAVGPTHNGELPRAACAAGRKGVLDHRLDHWLRATLTMESSLSCLRSWRKEGLAGLAAMSASTSASASPPPAAKSASVSENVSASS